MLIGETPGMWLEAESVKLGRFADASPDHRARLDELPGGLERVLVKALAMRPSLRYQTPTEFAFDVESSLTGRPMYREGEAKQIIERAAQLEVGKPTQGDDYALSIGGVQRVAAEAGIRPEFVEQAARGLEPHKEGLVHGGVLGIQPTLNLQRVVVGAPIEKADYAPLLEEIRQSLGQMGQLEATLDDSFAWVSSTGTRKAHVFVTPQGERTRIRMVDSEPTPQGVVFVPLGAASAVLFGITGAIASGAGLTDPVAAVIAGGVGLTAFLSGWSGLRFLHRRQMRRRYEKLKGLIARLESIVLERGRKPSADTMKQDDDLRELFDG